MAPRTAPHRTAPPSRTDRAARVANQNLAGGVPWTSSGVMDGLLNSTGNDDRNSWMNTPPDSQQLRAFCLRAGEVRFEADRARVALQRIRDQPCQKGAGAQNALSLFGQPAQKSGRSWLGL